MSLIHFFRRLFDKKKFPVHRAKAKPKIRAEMEVTRADGSKEYYVADEKGQRRIK